MITTFSPSEPVNLSILMNNMMADREFCVKIEASSRSIENDDLYACDACRETFQSPNDLKDHLKTHFVGDFFVALGPKSVQDEDRQNDLSVKQELNPNDESQRAVRSTHEPTVGQGQEDGTAIDLMVRNEKRTTMKSETRDDLYREDDTTTVDFMACIDKGPKKKEDMIVNTDTLHICSVCGKTFTQRSSLNVHQRIHTDQRPYGCSDCNKYFGRKECLRRHILNTHIKDKAYRCTECGKCFTQKENYNRHLRIHSGEKPYGCSICEKRFGQKEDLEKHFRIHSGDKPYGCSICGKSFSRNDVLVRHMRIHSGERPYACSESECRETFSRKETLDLHTLKMHGNTDSNVIPKGYPCSVCAKTFLQTGKLEQHKRTHSGVKPYQCSQCGRTFCFKGNMDKHMNIHSHSEKKQHGCSVCGKKYSSSEYLRKHTRKHSEDN